MATVPETVPDDAKVLFAVKTPIMPRPTTAFLPRELNLAQAIEQLRAMPPKDANATRVLQQLARETSAGAFDFLALTPTGEMVKVRPTTTLQEIAFPREVRTPTGLKTVPSVGLEVQAYSPVGVSSPC
jgi:hypothetical protein